MMGLGYIINNEVIDIVVINYPEVMLLLLSLLLLRLLFRALRLLLVILQIDIIF